MSIQSLSSKRGSYLGTISGSQRLATAASIGTGATNNYDVDVSDFDNCTVLVQMTGAANGDLAVTVAPFETDDATAFPLGLTAAAASGPTFASPNVNYIGQFDLRGVRKLRVSVKNNNAGTQTVNFVDILTGVTGVDF